MNEEDRSLAARALKEYGNLRMDTDVIGGVESGMETVLVLTGVSNRENIRQFSYQPHYILNGIGDLVPEK